MKIRIVLINFIIKEWLLISSAIFLILTTLYKKEFPSYSINELEILSILFELFIVVNGLQRSGLILKIAQIIERGRLLPLKLILATFFLSMLITNDIALIVIVPLTLSLNINRKDILIILEALATNSGSALTPIGNPQNLFIYWFYNTPPNLFIEVIAPFSLTFLILLTIFSLLIKVENGLENREFQKVDKKAYIYLILLITTLLIVFHILPTFSGIIIILFALIFDREALKIDYALLLTFLLFFGIADNLKSIISSEIDYSEHIFLFSALASQFISNVPATLLFAKFTSNWEALLWGSNVGGFGSLIGSLANLIAYKLYISHKDTNNKIKFTIKFLIIGYIAFFFSIGLYFLL